MNAFTLLVILAGMAGLTYGYYRLLCWISDADNWFPEPETVSDPGFQKTEPPRYEITRIVHKQPGPEFGQPIHYSGFARPIFDSYDPGTGVGVPPDEPSAVERRGWDEAFDELRQRIETIRRHEDEIRRIADRSVRKREGRRPEREEDGSGEGSPGERRTYRPGEVRGPDPINEIRFGGI